MQTSKNGVESDPALTMSGTEAVPRLLASLERPTHLRSSSYDQWEAIEPLDHHLLPRFSCNRLRRQCDRNYEFVHLMDESSTTGEHGFHLYYYSILYNIGFNV